MKDDVVARLSVVLTSPRVCVNISKQSDIFVSFHFDLEVAHYWSLKVHSLVCLTPLIEGCIVEMQKNGYMRSHTPWYNSWRSWC